MLVVKNWSEFQHYKDRNPIWIKLHRAILDDYTFASLPDHAKAHLVGIWCLAAGNDGKIPNDPAWVGQRINARQAVDLEALVAAGLLVAETQVSATAAQKWGRRSVPQRIRALVMARDGHKCTACGTAQHLELDHIVPVSQGGNPEPDNLQVLCRQCNRRKRVRSTDYRGPAQRVEQVATHMRSLEKRREEERREEKKRAEQQPVAIEAPQP
ncbi:MAG: HNH endonuclease, partial [Candidatus Sericytochromatia bacterium]|nr:HNH endonuclease [Candidatus Sericytochromatia bacterium]